MTHQIGDTVTATLEIVRHDGRNTLKVGETATVTTVYVGQGCQIVNIQPDRGGLPLWDIVIFNKEPGVPLK